MTVVDPGCTVLSLTSLKSQLTNTTILIHDSIEKYLMKKECFEVPVFYFAKLVMSSGQKNKFPF